MRPILAIFVAFVWLLPLATVAQIKITGKIIDSDSKPVDFAEVLLLTTDSTAVKVAFSDSVGRFQVEAPKGEYILQLRQLGKVLYAHALLLEKDTAMGTIPVQTLKILQEVVITARKPLIERKIDRFVFHVENSIAATGGDAIDVLRIAPGLQVQNDQVAIIGRSSMQVMVNERLILLTGEDLIHFLKNLKAEDIKSIEVITTPPAKYEAQGNSGLINIVMKEAKNNSFNGSARASLSQSRQSIGSTGLSLNYQKNRLTLTSSTSYTTGSTTPYQRYILSYPTYRWFEENQKRSYIHSIGSRSTIDYKASAKTRLGADYTFSNGTPVVEASHISSVYPAASTIADSTIRNESRVTTNKTMHTANLYALTKLDTSGKKITFDLGYINYDSQTNNRFYTHSFDANNVAISNRAFSAKNAGNQNIHILTTKLDVDYPTQWANISFGGKLTFIQTKSQVSLFNSITGTDILDPAQSNAFTYTESTHALYASVNKTLTSKIEMLLGLRGENTQTTGYSQTLDQTHTNNYFQWFPTAFLMYSLNAEKTISLSYSRRIDRPSYKDVNPFRFYSTAYNYSEGNPFLQPYFTHNAELSLSQGNRQGSIYVQASRNNYDQVTYVSTDNYTQVVKPANFYNQTTIGFQQSYSFTVKKWWENSSYLSVFYSQTTSSIPEVVPNISHWSGSFNTQNTFVLDTKRHYKTEFSASYQLPSIAGSYRLSSYAQINVGIKASWIKNTLQASLTVVDIFKTNKQTFTQTVNRITQENLDYADLRRIRVSLTYSFGKQFKIDNKKTSNTDEQQRLN